MPKDSRDLSLFNRERKGWNIQTVRANIVGDRHFVLCVINFYIYSKLKIMDRASDAIGETPPVSPRVTRNQAERRAKDLDDDENL